MTFDVNASGAKGLTLGLQAIIGYAVLTGIEISRVNAAPATWTASAEVSYDGGNSWTTIATGLSLDFFGAGSFSFTPTTGYYDRPPPDRRQQRPADGFRHFPGHVPGRAGRQRLLCQHHRQRFQFGHVTELPDGQPRRAPQRLHDATRRYDFCRRRNLHAPVGRCVGRRRLGQPGDPVQIIGQGASTIFKSASNAATSSMFQFTGGHDVTIENMVLSGGGIGVNISRMSEPGIFPCRDSISPGSRPRASASALAPRASRSPDRASTIRRPYGATTASTSTQPSLRRSATTVSRTCATG